MNARLHYTKLALTCLDQAFAPWAPLPGEPETEASRLDRQAFNGQDKQLAMISAIAAVALSNLAAAQAEGEEDYAD